MYQKPEDKQKAEFLYLHTDLSQQEISALVGVSRRTIYTWVRESSWKRAKYIAKNAPLLLVEQYYNQLGAINAAIAARADRPYPTREEAEIIRKLTITINHMGGVENTISNVISVFMDYHKHLASLDNDLAKQHIGPMDEYIQEIVRLSGNKDNIWSDYHRHAEKDRELEEEMREQQSEQTAREAARKKAADEQFENADGKTNEQFETSKTEHNKLIINTNEETPSNEIAQPAISEKTGKYPPVHSPGYHTGGQQAKHNTGSA